MLDDGRRAERARGLNTRGDIASQNEWNSAFSDLTPAAGMRLLDFLASERIPPQQFIDDSIVLASELTNLASANNALSSFVHKWRHAYQGGAKAPRVLAIGASRPDPEECGTVGGVTVHPCDKAKFLGHWIDEGLTFRPQARVIQAKLRTAGRKIAATMCDAGFGLPFMAAQYSARVENAALAGIELVASARGGFKRVMHELNMTQIDVAKGFLGLPERQQCGSRVAVLAETRLLTRTGTAAAVRVVMARARLACLPPAHPASAAARAASRLPYGGTWLDHSRY